MGTVETGTLSQLLLWSAKWLGDPSKGNTSQGTDGATLGLLSRLSGVPGQVAEVPLQPPITPMTPTTPTTLTTPTTPTSREGTSSHTFDQTPMPMPVPMPQPMQPGNCGSGGCGQIPQPSRCQLGSGPQMGPLLGPIATTGCGASDRDMPTYGAPSNGWMPGNSWMTKPWPQQPAPMPMPMPEPMPSGNCGPGGCGQEREDCNSCGK